MMDLDAFKTPSLTKKMVFFMLSFFSGIWGLFFIDPENFWIKGGLILFSITTSFVFSVLFQKKYFLVILPLFFWGMGKFLGISDMEQLGITFFALGILFSGLSFLQSYQEKIKLSFFRDSFSAFTKGGIFFLLGAFLSLGGNFSLSQASFNLSQFSEPILEKMIAQNFSVENTRSFYSQCDIFPSAQKKTCIKKIDTQIAEKKKEMHQKISDELEKNIQKWTSPESLQALAKDNGIPLPENFSLETLKIMVLLLFAFFLLLPFIPLLGVGGGIFSSLLFSLLIVSGTLTLTTREVKKEVMY